MEPCQPMIWPRRRLENKYLYFSVTFLFLVVLPISHAKWKPEERVIDAINKEQAKYGWKQMMERYPILRKIVGNQEVVGGKPCPGKLIGTECSFDEVMSNKIRNKVR